MFAARLKEIKLEMRIICSNLPESIDLSLLHAKVEEESQGLSLKDQVALWSTVLMQARELELFYLQSEGM